jgi:hypothetical protein
LHGWLLHWLVAARLAAAPLAAAARLAARLVAWLAAAACSLTGCCIGWLFHGYCAPPVRMERPQLKRRILEGFCFFVSSHASCCFEFHLAFSAQLLRAFNSAS